MIVLFIIIVLVIFPVAIAFLTQTSLFSPAAFGLGAPLVYRRQEISTHPSADARDVRPSERGEFYYYSVVNYLRVAELLDDGRVIAVARNDKRLCFWPNDCQFRKASLIERCIYRWRFPHF